MNLVVQTGYMTKDAEVKTLSNGIKIARFTIAVKRKYKNQDGEYDTDFFNCSAFRHSADFIEKYLAKGSKITIQGRLENRSYESDGEKKYYTEIVVEDIQGDKPKTAVEKEVEKGYLIPMDDDFSDCPF